MIEAIETHLPSTVLSNEDLAREFGSWTAEQITQKTGIRERRIAGPDEFASDLATQAAEKLLATRNREAIDFLLLCTQSADYLLPTTACVLQDRLKLPKQIGAMDFNLGCSGYIYGLAVSCGLLESGIARQILFLTSDTYSKFIHPQDKSTRTIFGDGATASLLSSASPQKLHSFVFGTDGSGATQLFLRKGGVRSHFPEPPSGISGQPEPVNGGCLFMNGPEVFNFTIRRVPQLVSDVLSKARLSSSDIDYFVFHQANAYMLDHLRRKMNIPPEKFVICLEQSGNIVSGTIPLALKSLLEARRLAPGSKLLLCGFGVGLSWAGCILDWNEAQ